MEWPSWLKFKPLGLKELSTNSALNPIAYVFLACIGFTFLAAFFEDKLFLRGMLGLVDKA